MPFIDKEAVKAAVSMEAAIDILGLEMRSEGKAFRGGCPACGGADRELVITPAKGAYYCFSDKHGGDVIQLAMHVQGVSFKDALAFLAEHVSGTSTSTSPVQVPTPRQQRPLTSKSSSFDRTKYQAGLDREHELLKDIPKDFLERADIGVSNKGALKGIVLPLYDHQTGEFLCYAKVEGLQLPKATVVPLKKAG